MEIQIDSLPVRDRYKLLIGTVVPRPIAWVTSLSAAGAVNLAPFSYFNAVASNPPTLAVSFSWNQDRDDHRKDSLRNIERTHECVVNLVTASDAEVMNLTASDFPEDVGEAAHLGVPLSDARTVSTPRVASSPVAFECRLDRTVQIGSGPGSSTLVLLTVQHVYVADGLVDEDLHVNVEKLAPVARLAGNSYSLLQPPFTLERRRFSGI